MSKYNKGCTLVETKILNNNNQSNNTTTTTSKVCNPCLPTTVFCVVLQSSVSHIGKCKSHAKIQINLYPSFIPNPLAKLVSCLRYAIGGA